MGQSTRAQPEDAPLAGEWAIVTGAGSGIGRAIALALGREGMRLVLVGRTGESLRETARLSGGDAQVMVADLAADVGVRTVAQATPGPIRVLVYSAGLFLRRPVADTTAEEWGAIDAVNVQAPMRLTGSCLGALRQGAHVVFINSTSGLRANAGTGAYAASKHALRAAADALREEVNARGIRVLSVFPGRTDTPMQEAVLTAEGRAASASALPPGTLLYPEDVAAMVVAAVRLPSRAEVTELTIRPSAPL